VVREGVALFAPLLVGVLLAYALEPFVTLVAECRLPRPLAPDCRRPVMVTIKAAADHIEPLQPLGELPGR